MQLDYIIHRDNPRLLLIMAGWGMDSRPFSGLEAAGYDIAVGWDYTDETFDTSLLADYREIVVFGWSMGVMEAARILVGRGLPITLSVAINGTETPVSNTVGIPVDIFNATLSSLSPENLSRFNRRMCGSRDRLKQFELHAPQRDIVSLVEELRVIGQRAIKEPPVHFDWDVAIIGTTDNIFPPKSQHTAWEGREIIETDAPHIVDFQSIINRLLVNKNRVAGRFDNTRDRYDNFATVQNEVASTLASLFYKSTSRRHFYSAIEIGTGSGRLTSAICNQLSIDHLELWDIAPMTIENQPNKATIVDDAEARLFEVQDGQTDFIFSASTLQWFNSPRTALFNICRALAPGGIAALSLYVKGTFSSLSQATDSSLHYIDTNQLVSSLPRSCQIKAVDTRLINQEFPSTLQLLNHIKDTGVNGTQGVDIATLRRVIADNTIRTLEYNTLYLIIEKI